MLVTKMQEVAVVPPQTVGPFTGIYKRIVPSLKVAPWRSVVLTSFLLTCCLYFLFGPLLVRLASFLQFGF
jgi:hypothetical protein